MHFSRVASFFLVFFGVGLLALANPIGESNIAKRQNADAISGILGTLTGAVSPIVASLNDAATSGNATSDSVAPQFAALTTALDTASTALGALDVLPISLAKRQEDEIASTVAGLVTNIVSAVGALSDAGVSVDSFVPGLDASLSQVLSGLETLLAGVLNLVATLLVDVAALLRRLAFALTLAAIFS